MKFGALGGTCCFYVLLVSCVLSRVSSITVNLGLFDGEAEPAVVAVHYQYFNVPGYNIAMYPQTSGGRVIKKIENGELDISALGSAPFAIGVSRGVLMTSFAVLHTTGQSEALVAKFSNPQDIVGKTMATIPTSTAHFHTEFMFEVFNIDRSLVTVLFLEPSQMAPAWDAGTIDAAFCWGSCITHALANGGRILVPSGYLNTWGKETYNNYVVRNSFLQDHPGFVQHFLDVNMLFVGDFLSNPELWKAGTSNAAALVSVLKGEAAVGDVEVTTAVVGGLAQFVQVGVAVQASCSYLPDSAVAGNCPGGFGGMVVSVRAASEFMQDVKVLLRAAPEPEYYVPFVDGQLLQQTLASTLVLSDLVATPFLEFTVGDASPCVGHVTLTEATGTFTDGHGVNGSYANLADCLWTVVPGGEEASSDPLLLSFPLLALERDADWVRVYGGLTTDGPLLAQYTGHSFMGLAAEDEGGRWPPVAHTGPITIHFTSDDIADAPFRLPVNQGVSVSFASTAVCTTDDDCGANGACLSSTGLCQCADGWFGARCSTTHCLGTTSVAVNPQSVASLRGSAGPTMGHNADCRWVLTPPAGGVVDLAFTSFQLDEGHDILRIYDGPDVSSNSPLLAQFTGYRLPSVVRGSGGPLTVRFTSDSLNASAGFELEHTSVSYSGCVSEVDCLGRGVCDTTSAACVCDDGYFGPFCAADTCVPVSGSLGGSTGQFRSQHADSLTYDNLASCVWTVAPEPLDGVPATGVLLMVTKWDVEQSDGDVVEVRDETGAESLALFRTVSAVCITDSDCWGNGLCVKDSEREIEGLCECFQGFVNGDCTLGVAAAPTLIPHSRVSVEFRTDFNNPRELRGFVVSYEGVYPCPTDVSRAECSEHGECRLAVCQCHEGYTGADCSTVIDRSGGEDGGALLIVLLLIAVVVLMVVSVVAFRNQKKLTATVNILHSAHMLSADQQEMIERIMNRTEEEEENASINQLKIKWDDITLVEAKARGSFGEVWRGKYLGTEVAVKLLLAESITQSAIQSFKAELELMGSLRHPSILYMYGGCWEPPHLCLVLEYMALGGLDSVLQNPEETLTWMDPKMNMAIAVASGMEYLHAMDPPVMHRDLKAANIVVSSRYSVRVADFGASRRVTLGSENEMTVIGTQMWMAPEVIAGDAFDSTEVDVYSFALLLAEMVIGTSTLMQLYGASAGFGASNGAAYISRKVLEGGRPDLHALPGDVDAVPGLEQLIKHCWSQDPAARPTFSEIVRSLESLAAGMRGGGAPVAN